MPRPRPSLLRDQSRINDDLVEVDRAKRVDSSSSKGGTKRSLHRYLARYRLDRCSYTLRAVTGFGSERVEPLPRHLIVIARRLRC